MYLHHPQILRAVELAPGGALGTARARPAARSRSSWTTPDDPRIDPDDGRRLAVGRRLLSGQPRPPDRRRGARRRSRPSPGSTTAASTGRSSASSASPSGLLAQFDSRLRRARPRADRGRRQRCDPRPRHSVPARARRPAALADDVARPGRHPDRGRDLDQYAAEVEDFSAAILDDRPPESTSASVGVPSRRSRTWTESLEPTPG